MLQKLVTGGVIAALGAVMIALVGLGSTGTASANVIQIAANPTTINAGGLIAAPATATHSVITIDGENDADLRILATTGTIHVDTGLTATSCTGGTVACAGETGSGTGDVTIPVAGNDLDVVLVTYQGPATGPASASITGIQDNVAKSATVTVRGSADTVELSAFNAASTSATTCEGTTVNVIDSTTANALNDNVAGASTAFLCTLVKDSSGTRLPNQAVIYSTTDGTVAPLTDITGATGQRANASVLSAGTTGANGDSATVTASAGGKSATVDVAFGGNPSTCTIVADPATVQTGGSSSITVEVKDNAGGLVPDGTTVALQQVNPGSGANAAVLGSPSTTTNGQASFSVIAAIPGAIALGANSPNGTGAAPISCTGSVQATGTVAPPSGGTSGTGGFTGTAPSAGSIGLLVTSEASDAAGLIAALGTAGCTVESLAVLEAGTWKVYINGAPDVVNAAFPASLAATTPFFTRCA